MKKLLDSPGFNALMLGLALANIVLAASQGLTIAPILWGLTAACIVVERATNGKPKWWASTLWGLLACAGFVFQVIVQK